MCLDQATLTFFKSLLLQKRDNSFHLNLQIPIGWHNVSGCGLHRDFGCRNVYGLLSFFYLSVLFRHIFKRKVTALLLLSCFFLLLRRGKSLAFSWILWFFSPNSFTTILSCSCWNSQWKKLLCLCARKPGRWLVPLIARNQCWVYGRAAKEAPSSPSPELHPWGWHCHDSWETWTMGQVALLQRLEQAVCGGGT